MPKFGSYTELTTLADADTVLVKDASAGLTKYITATNLAAYVANETVDLDGISDVAITSLSSGEVLWTSDGSTWINGTLAEADIAAASRTVTIAVGSASLTTSAGAQDLTANRTWTLDTAQDIQATASPTFVGLTLSADLVTTSTIDGVDIAALSSAYTTHAASDGSDHTFIDQDVTSGSTPTFGGANITGVATVLEAAVTAHEAALTVTASQVSDFSTAADARIALAVLDDLADVTETTITTGDLLRWNGSAWVNYADSNFGSASDVSSNTTHRTSDGSDHTFIDQDVTSGSTPTFTATNFTGASGITGLGTVASGVWQGTAVQGAYTDIDVAELTDVTITTIGTGELLKWNGSAFINNTLAEADIAAASRTVTIAVGSASLTTSAGAQDLTANRTWTLDTAQDIQATASPTFVGLTLSADLVTTSTIDGVDIAGLNSAYTTHAASDGSDHTFIDQSVTSGSTPTFTGTNITGVPAASILAGTFGTGAFVFDNTVSGITTLTATTLNGTLGTAAQPNVTSLGSSLTVGNAANAYLTMDAGEGGAGESQINLRDNNSYIWSLRGSATQFRILDAANGYTAVLSATTGAGSLLIASDLTLASGSITSASGAIDFGNETIAFGGDVTLSKTGDTTHTARTTGATKASVYAVRNDGDGALWQGIYGSTKTGTTFGQSNNDLAFLTTLTYSTGYPSGLAVGTLGSQSVYVGTNGSLRYEIDSSGNHDFQSGTITTTGAISGGAGSGFGIAPTDGTLHVHTASAGAVTANAVASDLVVEGSTANVGISILAPDASGSNILFGSPGSDYGARIFHQYSTGQFWVGSRKVGGSTLLKGDNQVTNLTLSGASGSELMVAAGDIQVNGTGTSYFDNLTAFVLGGTSTSSNAQLYATKTYSNASGSDDGSYLSYIQSGATTGRLSALHSAISASATTGTIANARGVYAQATAGGSGGTTTNLSALYTYLTVNTGHTATNAFGLYIDAFTGSGTFTNRWGIYQAGASDNNYLAGNLGLGTTTVTDILNLGTATESCAVVDAGSASATEQDWIEVKVGGNTGYIRVFATK